MPTFEDLFPSLAGTAAIRLTPGAAKNATAAEALPLGVEQRSADVDGVRIGYKIAGEGPPVVLLHGFAQTSHMWLPLMTRLAADHTVIAPDLRGAGASDRTAGGYDKKTMGREVRELVRQLGFDQPIALAGHDIGLMVAYSYAAQFPSEVERLVLMDAFLPGIGEWKDVWLAPATWHFHFHGEIPERLVEGRERTYLEHFWNDFAGDPAHSVSEADRQIYAAAYARDGGIHATMQYFSTFVQDATDNAALAANELPMPTLVMSGEKASGRFLIEQTRLIAKEVTGEVVAGAGHWLMEEAPDQVIPRLAAFLAGET